VVVVVLPQQALAYLVLVRVVQAALTLKVDSLLHFLVSLSLLVLVVLVVQE
jgi:hypothetical protein